MRCFYHKKDFALWLHHAHLMLVLSWKIHLLSSFTCRFHCSPTLLLYCDTNVLQSFRTWKLHSLVVQRCLLYTLAFLSSRSLVLTATLSSLCIVRYQAGKTPEVEQSSQAVELPALLPLPHPAVVLQHPRSRERARRGAPAQHHHQLRVCGR